jgi:LacI family transcriptional regulator
MLKTKSPGTARANISIKDIAKHLGIAHSTVSRALGDHPYTNRNTKERVRRAAEKLGYIPHAAARALRSDKGVLIGLIVPNITSEAFAAAAQTLSHRCLTEGLQVVLAISEDDPDLEYRHVAALRAARAAGIVIAPSGTPHEKTISLLRSVPTVQYARHHSRISAPSVAVDSKRGIALATQHLLQLGHRRIAYLGPDRAISTGTDRLAGFVDAHVRFGVKPSMAMALTGATDSDLVQTRLMEMMQSRARPTGVIFGAGSGIAGALLALRDSQLEVPRDISIIGYGNPEWYGAWGPGITTVAQPFIQMANAAASELIAQIADPTKAPAKPLRIKLAPEFIVRGSTTRPLPQGARRVSRPAAAPSSEFAGA